MHEISDTLGDVVKAARENKSITIECLAEKLGISERYLYRIENEHKNRVTLSYISLSENLE